MSKEELQILNNLFAYYNRLWVELKIPTKEEMMADIAAYRDRERINQQKEVA